MRTLLLFALALISQPPAAPAPAPHAAEHHEFVIDNFKTEAASYCRRRALSTAPTAS
jgi:hypothetical protein